MLDENEFLSPYGIRSLSRYHEEHPFRFYLEGQEYKVQYLPAESNNGMFGGNSNWRGPIWMPVNMLIVRSLLNMYQFYGDDFAWNARPGPATTSRSSRWRRKSRDGCRRSFSATAAIARCTEEREVSGRSALARYILFYEYFHGDNGAGLGASHQTGWTGLIAMALDVSARVSPEAALQMPKSLLAAEVRIAGV